MKYAIKKDPNGFTLKSFYPKDYYPFRSIRVADAFPISEWARLPILRDCFTLVPNRIPDDAPIRKRQDIQACFTAARKFVDRVRRQDIKRVIARATREAKERGMTKVVKQLSKLQPARMHLPASIIYRYAKVITTRSYWRTSDKPDKVDVKRVSAFWHLGINYILQYGYTDPQYVLRYSPDSELAESCEINEGV